MQKQGFKIEMANVATLMQRAIEGKQIATKAKIARNELKAKAKENFKIEENAVKNYFPKDKDEAAVQYAQNFEMLGKRHGEVKEDKRTIK